MFYEMIPLSGIPEEKNNQNFPLQIGNNSFTF
jgi:hypothetical protein